MIQLIKEQITEFLFRVEVQGPIQQTSRRQPVGQEQHQSLGSFESTSGPGAGPGGLPAASQKAPEITVSGGGASRRKSSRKRRR